MPQTISVPPIPVPLEVFHLSKIFKAAGHEIYGVGGFIRDFLISQEEGAEFYPKDIDLATEAQPRQIADLLDKAGVYNFEKGESFGVWVAHLNGIDFEIATFRTDGEYKDGRHPEGVEWTTAENDYKRRDLTINALYYRFPIDSSEGVIIDYGDGAGFQDIKDRRVRTVGEPAARFTEDKLRVLRAVRFHHRFNNCEICDKVGTNFVVALREFHELRKHGISGPRIMTEFLACLRQAKSIDKLIFDLNWLDLLPEIFGELKYDLCQLRTFNGTKPDPAVVIAWLLRYCSVDQVGTVLNKLNYSNEIVNDVVFLLEVFPLLSAGSVDNRDERLVLAAINLTKNNHRRLQLLHFLRPMSQYFGYDSIVSGHLVNYEVKFYDGNELMDQYKLAPGPELGKLIRKLYLRDYLESLRQHCE